MNLTDEEKEEEQAVAYSNAPIVEEPVQRDDVIESLAT